MKVYMQVQSGLTFHLTHYMSFLGQLYGSDDPRNIVIALKDNGQSTRLGPIPPGSSSLKGKEKYVTKTNLLCIQHHKNRRYRDARMIRELNQARSKPHMDNQPVRTVRTFVHHCNSTLYSRDSFINIPLPPDQRGQGPIPPDTAH